MFITDKLFHHHEVNKTVIFTTNLKIYYFLLLTVSSNMGYKALLFEVRLCEQKVKELWDSKSNSLNTQLTN